GRRQGPSGRRARRWLPAGEGAHRSRRAGGGYALLQGCEGGGGEADSALEPSRLADEGDQVDAVDPAERPQLDHVDAPLAGLALGDERGIRLELLAHLLLGQPGTLAGLPQRL